MKTAILFSIIGAFVGGAMNTIQAYLVRPGFFHRAHTDMARLIVAEYNTRRRALMGGVSGFLAHGFVWFFIGITWTADPSNHWKIILGFVLCGFIFTAAYGNPFTGFNGASFGAWLMPGILSIFTS
jgi:hypothetical protein